MPKIVDHDERRRELAAAATRVALAAGVDALTVRSVAAEAGVSTGALAHYFSTKDDLLIAVQREAGGASIARIEACFDRYEGRRLLEGVILSVLPLDEARRGEWRLWLAYFARAAEVAALAEVQREHYQGWRALLRDACRGARSEPPGRAELDAATDTTMALIQGLGVLGTYGPAGVTAPRLRRLVREHLDRWFP